MERASASRDCFSDGGALAEVLKLYENMDVESVDSPSDSMQSNNLTEHRSQQMVVKVQTADIYKICYPYIKL